MIIQMDTTSGLDHLADAVASMFEGNRNNHLVWATMRAVEEGYANEDIRDVLTHAAKRSGLPLFEARRTIDSGIRKAEREGKRGRLADAAPARDLAAEFEAWSNSPMAEKERELDEAWARGDRPNDPDHGEDDEGPAHDERILNVVDYLKMIPTDIPWIIGGFVFHHGVTLITGLPKAGKSTFTTEMIRCLEEAQPFLERAVKPVPALLVTEESGVPVGYKVRGLKKLDIFDLQAAAGETFIDTLNRITRWTDRNPGGVVFIDTLSVWASIEDENDASKVTTALKLIKRVAAEYDCAIVLVHHARKGGGTNGEAVRGSGAIVANVDVLIEVKRVEGDQTRTRRNVDAMGRVIVEGRTLVDFDPETRRYALLDPNEIAVEEIEAKLVGIPTTGQGMTRAQIGDLWTMTNPRKPIERLLNRGRLRTERVKVGRAWRDVFWAIPPQFARRPQFEEVDD